MKRMRMPSGFRFQVSGLTSYWVTSMAASAIPSSGKSPQRCCAHLGPLKASTVHNRDGSASQHPPTAVYLPLRRKAKTSSGRSSSISPWYLHAHAMMMVASHLAYSHHRYNVF